MRSHGRESVRPPSTHRVCRKSERRAFLAPSRFASLGCSRQRSPCCAPPRFSATGRSGARGRGAGARWGPAAATLVRLDLLRSEDPLEFFHPVVRNAVYETLDVVERAAAHRLAAVVLLDAGAPPGGAAGHLLHITPKADSFVVTTLRQAAERSLFQGAADAAVEYLTRALEEQTDPATRAEVLVELGCA